MQTSRSSRKCIRVHVEVVEDIPLRKPFRQPDDPKTSQIPRNRHPVSLHPKYWNPTEYAVDPEYDEAEAQWFINLKKSKQAMDDQREEDIFDDFAQSWKPSMHP